MEEKYFMIVWEYVHIYNDLDAISKLDNRRDCESIFRSEIKTIFKDQITPDHETKIKNACIIKISSPIEEIRFKIAKILISNPSFGAFGTGCRFEVHVLQMDFSVPVLPIEN